MRKKFTKLTAALVLLAFLAIPMGMRGQAPVNTTLWGETWTGGAANTTPSAYNFSGTTVYGGATLTYAQSSTATKLYAEELAGGSSPELLLSKSNQTWTISNIPTGQATGMSLTFLSNKTTFAVTSTTNGITISGSQKSWTITVTGSVTNFDLTIKNTGSANARIDNIVLSVTTAGAGALTVATPTFNPAGCSFLNSQEVALTCATEGATIYYTLNGDTPTTSSTEYTAPFTLTQTTTVKAFAVKANYDDSDVAEATFTKVSPLANIAALTANTTNGTYYVTLDDAVVTYVNGNNAYIQDASGAVAMYKSGHGLTAGDVFNGTATVTYQLRNQNPQITDLAGVTPVSGTAPNPTEVAASAWDYTFSNVLSQYFKVTGATITQSNNKYYVSLGGESIQLYKASGTISSLDLTKTYSIIGFPTMYNTTKELQIYVDPEVEVTTTPSVTVTPTTINAPFAGAEGTLALAYENIEEFISFDYYFCDAEGEELEEDPDWIYAEINEENDVYSVSYIIDSNDGEARTAYFKVYTFVGDELEEVYAIVTVNQEEYVAPTYAELPFEFNGRRDDIENTDGLYQEGLGTDYNASTNPNTQLKFDGTGDWLLLQFNERPGTLTFDIKGNNFNGGTFKVQTSENGTSYTDLQTYTSFGSSVESEEFDNLGENVRYIKWVYVEKASGNVGLGNITLATYEAPVPAITVDSTIITATFEETEGTLNVTYTAIETDLGIDIYWFESDGTTTATEPDWVLVEVNSGLNVDYVIEANDGAARTAYFKLYGLDEEANSVYSELVTITQAAAPQQYTLTVEPFENLELITFVNDDMVLEADGEIQVNEGVHIMLSIVADEGYVMETLMVNGVNHVNDIAADFTYEFDMPAEAVTISATAVEQVAPVGGDYVRITSLDQLTDGSIVVIAARYDEEHTNGYYAMSNATSGKPTGVLFTSTTSGDNEILPASIVDYEDDYYWVVNETENGFTLTNAEGFMIGYNSSTNFATGGNNTEWTIASYTASSTSMVPNYAGFKIVNFNQSGRAFALNESHNYGPYSTSNMNGNDAYKYNFSLDIFVQSENITPVLDTFQIEISGYGDITNSGNYYLIASPIGDVDPEEVENMLSNNYDLYYFNQAAEDAEWVNYKAHPDDDNFLKSGKGFLYANSEDVTLTFTGTAYSGDGIVTLTKTDGADWEGWNLVGNPFAEIVYIADGRDFYTMDEQGANIITATSNSIQSMEGVFVVADVDGEEIVFTTQAPANPGEKLVLNLSNGRNVIDRTIIRFGEGRQLPKFQLFENSTKVYIPMDGQDYAVVRSEEVGEMPVNFKAEENGTYTLTFDSENVEFAYLHLIDNLTDTDVDVLATPSYSFEANTVDNANRFKLVYATGILSVSENFAFFNNGNFVINNEGKATLQVIDITGRVLSNETIDGSANVDLNAAPGVYMIRLANGDNVKVQKVVVR